VENIKSMKKLSFEEIYRLVLMIPAGKVATYGQLAALCGHPRAAKIIGSAMAACRDRSVPCHRVVDRFGGTKACFDTVTAGVQRMLLMDEGVVFTADGKIDLDQCLYDFPELQEK
jgi:methylated-DNA-protein-cysteine methyltransferase-like protein